MQKKFITNLILLLFLNLLIKPIWIFGIDRAVQNTVGLEQYGYFFAIFNFSFLFNILLDFGINNYNNRNISQNPHLVSKHMSAIIVLRFMLAAVYGIVTIGVGFLIGYDANQMYLLYFIAFNQFLIAFVLYLRSNLAGLQYFTLDSTISIIDRALMIIFCSVLLWGNVTETPFKIEWFVYLQTISYVITAIIVLIIVLSKTTILKLSWNLPFSIAILKKSLPFATLVMLMTVYNRFDGFIIERLLGDDGNRQAGIFASGFRMLDAANMMAYLFASLLLPMFSRMLKLKQNVLELIDLSYRVLIVPAMVVSCLCFVYKAEIISLLYTGIDEEGPQVFGWLMFCFIPVSLTYIFGTLLTAEGNLKQLNILAFSGMVLNIGLNFWLIPIYKALGAAYSSILTQVFVSLVQLYIVKKDFNFEINWKLITNSFIFFFTILFVSDFVKNFLIVDWFFTFALMVVVSILFAMALNLFSIKAILKILKSDTLV